MEKLLENPIKLPSIKTSASARVKDYMRVYSASSLLSTKSDFKKPLKSQKELASELLYSKKPTSLKLEKQKLNANLKKKEELLYDIAVAKSDKFEILRDLSTYEYELSQSIGLCPRLSSLESKIAGFPEKFLNFRNFSEKNQNIDKLITEKLGELHNLNTPSLHTSVISEIFPVRSHNDLKKMKLLHTSVLNISGIRALIQIKGDIFFENFLICLQTCEGDLCLNVKIKLDVLAVDTLNHVIDIPTAIKEKIIPHLYLIYYSRKIFLKFDENFPNEKNSVIINLKNYGKTSVLVWQFEESIILHITDPKYEKKINKSFLLNFDQSLASISLNKLGKILSKYLKYNTKGSEYEIEWAESGEIYFGRKESTSKLMSDEYIKESLGTQAFKRMWEQGIEINNFLYMIRCFQYHSHIKLVINSNEKSLEIKPESETYNYVLGLQSIDLCKNPKTLCASLEIKKLIKSYFLL